MAEKMKNRTTLSAFPKEKKQADIGLLFIF
jgi:hypothetical protein